MVIDASPASRTRIRRGWRFAQGLKADLLVVYFRRDLDPMRHAELIRTLDLAEDLNARIVALDVADGAERALASLIQAEHVNHAVLSHKPRGAFERLLGRSLADRLMRAVPHLDVHLVATE